MFDAIVQAFWNAIGITNILYSFGALTLGVFMGALPGVSGSLTLALLVPITYGLPTDTALIVLTASYCGAIYGGSISAILLNVPGTGGSAATCLDGYPMAQQGKGNTALGIAAGASVIGGLAGILAFVILAPIIARFSLYFNSPDYFLLAILGLSIVSRAAKGNMRKGLISAGLGLLICFIGYDPLTGYNRFSFGSMYLMSGIPFVQAMIGLFAISEALILVEQEIKSISYTKIVGSILKGVVIPFKYPITLIRSILIGIGIGALPGVGTSAANFMAYLVAKQSSKHPETFGEGDEEGVVAPESANNALLGGALVPTLTFGVPGNPGTAILLSGLLIHGLPIGNELFTTHAEITYTMVWGLTFATCFIIVVILLGGNILTKITLVPKEIIVPFIFVISVIGAYAIRGKSEDVLLAIVFGFLGYAIKKLNYSAVCLVLGLILGKMAELNFHRSIIIGMGSPLIFFSSLISIILVFLIFLILFLPDVQRMYLNIFRKDFKESG